MTVHDDATSTRPEPRPPSRGLQPARPLGRQGRRKMTSGGRNPGRACLGLSEAWGGVETVMGAVCATVWKRWLGAVLLILAVPASAMAVKVGDITDLQGSRINRLVGYGLVVGLKGSGDGGKYAPTMRALAQAHRRFANPILTLDELKGAKNVAIVEVEATLPRDGFREGERVDVKVASVGAAKSLLGGRLLLTPLVGPHPDDPRGAMALAGGPLQLEDPEVPTVARIARGATLEQSWIHNYLVLGRDLEVRIGYET